MAVAKAMPTVDVPLKATIETSIRMTVRLAPGEWVMGMWSIVRCDFEVYRDPKTGLWFTHVSYGNFRGVRGAVNANGVRRSGWSATPMYPGFNPKTEYIPLKVWDIVRATYETYGASPEILPPPDAAKGKGSAR